MKLEVSNDSLSSSSQTTVNQKQDYRYTGLLANNLKRTGDLLTLNYNDVSWLKQPFATRIVKRYSISSKRLYWIYKIKPRYRCLD